ncbi:hypothetical protein [Mycolicibacter sinensis]|uniref:hypothetical protein n=1 Tax=Mycolicibacter sinensis (strain JDM601) TaxID=875328 RepID=UPI0013016881|nr:hypothetical protein [Mycolicibacter sinensis]
MAAAIGADVEQLRSLAKQFTQGADRLEQASSGLGRVIGAAAYWRGNDADQFRTRWRSQSTPSITAAVKTLRTAAEALAHNADEQDQASAAGGSASTASNGPQSGAPKKFDIAAESMVGLWNRAHEATDTESGYVVQKITNTLGKTAYVVYIGGSELKLGGGQDAPGAVGSALDVPDWKQIEALKKIIDPSDAEVMLVGYSQGGMDAQNIAARNIFNVKQVVTFGSPMHNGLQVPTVNMIAKGDPWVAGAIALSTADSVAGNYTNPYSPAGAGGILNKLIPNNIANNDHYVYEQSVEGDAHTSYDQVAKSYDKMAASDGPPIQGFNAQLFKGTVDEVYSLPA